MKKTFICSLICPNGILGGALSINDTTVTYKTNKLTVDNRYKTIVLPATEICELSWKWIVFPIATLHIKNGEKYRFIIFNKKRFCKYFAFIKK